MGACLVYDASLAAYDLGADHPLRPERFTLAVSLMEAFGLLSPPAQAGARTLDVIAPVRATDEEIARVHDRRYIEVVRRLSRSDGDPWEARSFGLGTADTPVFPGMHEASALVAGSTLAATRDVLAGRHARAFSVAGGLHHAQRARASGFCVYNDCAIAIRDAIESDPGLRVAYVDIDAHHGDGVQAAFYFEPRVLTVSVHETGERLFPGTGSVRERGEGVAVGAAVNVPLPEGATDECYGIAFDRVVEPAVTAFAPGLVFAQCGADAHHDDPLTTLGLTVGGYAALVARIVAMADASPTGRLVACGGGGYGWRDAVPRCWTLLGAALAGRNLSDAIPATWLEAASGVTGAPAPRELRADGYPLAESERARLVEETRSICEEAAAWTRS